MKKGPTKKGHLQTFQVNGIIRKIINHHIDDTYYFSPEFDTEFLEVKSAKEYMKKEEIIGEYIDNDYFLIICKSQLPLMGKAMVLSKNKQLINFDENIKLDIKNASAEYIILSNAIQDVSYEFLVNLNTGLVTFKGTGHTFVDGQMSEIKDSSLIDIYDINVYDKNNKLIGVVDDDIDYWNVIDYIADEFNLNNGEAQLFTIPAFKLTLEPHLLPINKRRD